MTMIIWPTPAFSNLGSNSGAAVDVAADELVVDQRQTERVAVQRERLVDVAHHEGSAPDVDWDALGRGHRLGPHGWGRSEEAECSQANEGQCR